MKITLEFDGNDSDERAASVRAQKADNAYIALSNFDEWLRKEIKYNEMLSERETELLFKVRQKLSEEISDQEIDLTSELL
jgi:hypothetical protein